MAAWPFLRGRLPWKEEEDKTLHHGSPGAVFGSALSKGRAAALSWPCSQPCCAPVTLGQQTPKEESVTAQKTPVLPLCQQPSFVLHVGKGFGGAASQWQVSVWVFLLRTLCSTSPHVAPQLIFHLHPPVPDTFCLHWELIFARLMEPSWASRKRKKEEKRGERDPRGGRKRDWEYVVLEELAFPVKASVVFSSHLN